MDFGYGLLPDTVTVKSEGCFLVSSLVLSTLVLTLRNVGELRTGGR